MPSKSLQSVLNVGNIEGVEVGDGITGAEVLIVGNIEGVVVGDGVTGAAVTGADVWTCPCFVPAVSES